jgi:hypothetical protein
MSYDRSLQAAQIADGWSRLGVRLPKDLSSALDKLDAIRYAVIDHRPVFRLDGLTAENCEQRLADFAAELVTSTPLPGQHGTTPQSILGHAKAEALDVAAREILRAAGAAVPSIIEQLETPFRQAVQTFTEAVQSIPDVENLTSDALVAGGGSNLDSYHTAHDAAIFLESISGWLAGLHDVPAHAGHQSYPALRVLTPQTWSEYHQIIGERDHLRLPGYLCAAVRLGTPFELHIPADCTRIYTELERLPVESKGQPMFSVR